MKEITSMLVYSCSDFQKMLAKEKPQAAAYLHGNRENPKLNGVVQFYETQYGGLLIKAEVKHLPDEKNGINSAFYGFHIHEMGHCGKEFTLTGDHYNPRKQLHPQHAGDMPPLMSSHGCAWMVFFDGRLELRDILERSVVIHAMPDDFRTQPSGDSGMKIGCGIIQKTG